MPKREAELKAETMRQLRNATNFVILEYATAGAPDRAIIGNGVTTNWEFKHGTPDFESPGIQELTCMRLAAQGHCRYIIWQESPPCTLIVHPNHVHNRTGWRLEAEARCNGFSIGWLVTQIKQAHQL